MTGKGRDTPWSLKGVRPEVREMAKTAAARAGLPIGAWLSAAIRSVGEAELGEGATQGVPVRAESVIERAIAPQGERQAGAAAKPAAPPGKPASFTAADVEVQSLLDRAAARGNKD